jgi:pyridoxamine 5'-phosphate oxidase
MGDRPAFDPAQAPDDPIDLFQMWLSSATDQFARAVVLSTVDKFGHPDARIVMLRGVSTAGWSFSSSALSPKGRDLADTPWAALTWWWPASGRQVRARGAVVATDGAADFLARPADSRAEVVVGRRQSSPMADLDELRSALAQADVTAVPADWTSYELRPNEVEFFELASDRVHVRLRYDRAGDTWTRGLRWP